MVDHVVDTALLQLSIRETHDSIADHYSLEVDLLACSVVVVVDQDSKIGNVLSCVGFTSNPERVGGVLTETSKEVLQGVEVVQSC
jgi:hypothetical protein